MASLYPFLVSPNSVLSILGLIHGADKTVPTPAQDWRKATVNVVIPALNEETNISLCLASIAKQTKRPEKVMLIDDGSTDRTVEFATAFCKENGMVIEIIRRKAPIGKTPTLKRQAREFPFDVEFILDGDTVLESEDYIARVVEELYKGHGVASACGTILPLRDRDRKRLRSSPDIDKFLDVNSAASIYPRLTVRHHIQQGFTNLYREVLYMLLQLFIYRGQMVFFGSILNPVGCAVAYRRNYLENLFAKYEPILGDDLTNSEDIFIGFALLDQGYRNVQLTDVIARSQEPEVGNLPKQVYMWSSSFLQTCYYFDSLMRSPFKAFKRYRKEKAVPKDIVEARKIREQYRQPFGDAYTKTYGRPMGWVMFFSALEKISFPTIVLIMMLLGMWQMVGITLLAESLLSWMILTVVSKGHRWEFLLKGIVMTPVRYMVVVFDFFTMFRFAFDIWITRDKRWRK